MYTIRILNVLKQSGFVDFTIEVTDNAGINPMLRIEKSYADDIEDAVIQADFDTTIRAMWAQINQAALDAVTITQDVTVLDNI